MPSIPTPTLPPNTRSVGTPDPAGDMDNAVSDIGLLYALLSQLAGAGSNDPPGGNATNATALTNLYNAATFIPGTAGTVMMSFGPTAPPQFASTGAAFVFPTGNSTTDTNAINAASYALWNAGGGVVQLVWGVYSVTQLLLYSGVALRGVGRATGTSNGVSAANNRLGTVLAAPIGNTTDMLVLAPSAGVPAGITVRDLMIWGQNGTTYSGTTGAGVQTTVFNGLNVGGVGSFMPKQFKAENLLIREIPGSSIIVTGLGAGNGSMDGSSFTDIQIQFAGLYGWNSLVNTSDIHVSAVEVETSGDANFFIGGSHAIFTNCKANASGQLALGLGHEDGWCIPGSSNTIEGCEAENCGQNGTGTHGSGWGIYGQRNRIRGSAMTAKYAAVYLGAPVTTYQGTANSAASQNDIDVTLGWETANSQPAQQLVIDATCGQPVNNDVHIAGILPVTTLLSGGATNQIGYLRLPIMNYPSWTAGPTITPGVSGVLSSPTTVPNLPLSGFSGGTVISCYLTPSGGVGTETINVQLVATYDDGTTGTVNLPSFAGNAGLQTLSISNLRALIKNGHYIASLTVAASSSAATTSCTLPIEFSGLAV